MMATNTAIYDGLVSGQDGCFEDIIGKDTIVKTVSHNGPTIFRHFSFKSVFAKKGLIGIEAGNGHN